jgi:Ca2+:H+ antiporter
MNPLTDQRNRNNHNDSSNSSNSNSISSSATASSETELEKGLIGVDNDDDDNDDDGEEEDLLGFNYAILWLIIVAGFIALVSEFLTSSIEHAADDAGISRVFLASIILPIVGNAAEHFGAVLFAMKGKADLAIEVAVGSGTQVLVCVLPLLVIIAWICDLDLSLNLGAFESFALFLTIVMVTFAIKDGNATWLTGLQLIMAFIIISIAFAFHQDEDLSNKHPYSKH